MLYYCTIALLLLYYRQRVEMSIPRKQGAAAMGRDKAIHKFYDAGCLVLLYYCFTTAFLLLNYRQRVEMSIQGNAHVLCRRFSSTFVPLI